jgi:hypothetical protein
MWTEILVVSLPHVTVTGCATGKNDCSLCPEERVLSAEIERTEAIKAVGWAGLYIPAETEVERQLVGRAPVIL